MKINQNWWNMIKRWLFKIKWLQKYEYQFNTQSNMNAQFNCYNCLIKITTFLEIIWELVTRKSSQSGFLASWTIRHQYNTEIDKDNPWRNKEIKNRTCLRCGVEHSKRLSWWYEPSAQWAWYESSSFVHSDGVDRDEANILLMWRCCFWRRWRPLSWVFQSSEQLKELSTLQHWRSRIFIEIMGSYILQL